MELTGVADLPLHWGHVPPWLVKIMRRLAKEILEVAILELGREGLLRRLANPLWFQALNNAIGMDWDSSGSTTVTTAMIKEALLEINAGLRLAGGKGLLSRKTPEEIRKYGEELGLSSRRVEELTRISKLSAKTDNALLQDGFNLYHHTILFSEDGYWVVIQQGMNTELRYARRYHIAWYVSPDVTLDPHSGVVSDIKVKPLNLTSIKSLSTRRLIVDLLNEKPKKILQDVARANAILKGQRTLFGSLPRPILRDIPYYKPVRLNNRLLTVLKNAYEIKPKDMEEVLAVEGLGPEVLRALSLISELIYREPPSLDDPVTTPYSPFKYAFAIGGKDGIPYPVKKEVAEAVIKELAELIKNSKLGSKERLLAFRALRKLAPKDVSYV